MDNIKGVKSTKTRSDAIKTHQIMESNYSERKYPFCDNFRMSSEENLNKKLLYEMMRLDG